MQWTEFDTRDTPIWTNSRWAELRRTLKPSLEQHTKNMYVLAKKYFHAPLRH